MASLRAVYVKFYSLIFAKSILAKGASSLKECQDDDARKLAATLHHVRCNQWSKAETQYFASVEVLRKKLIQSDKRISTHDFGAGEATDKKNQIKMEAGKKISKPIGDFAVIGKSGLWAKLLYKIIVDYRPEQCLELGTCLGFSASYQSFGLKNIPSSRLVTIEGSQNLAEIAKENLNALGADNVTVITGRFQDVLDDTLADLREVNYVFIDGHHDEKATLDYFNRIYPFLSKNAIVLFDDISWSGGMKKAWRKIKADERILIACDLYVVGVCLVRKESTNT